MAGLFVLSPLNFWAQFLISKILGHLCNLTKEEMLMVIRVFKEVKSYAKQLLRSAITFWECHLPYGFNPLMIL